MKCHLPNLQVVIATEFIPHFLSGGPLAGLPCCYLEDANGEGVFQRLPHLKRADLEVLTTTPRVHRGSSSAVSPEQAPQW
jgi:hypothetical protein